MNMSLRHVRELRAALEKKVGKNHLMTKNICVVNELKTSYTKLWIVVKCFFF